MRITVLLGGVAAELDVSLSSGLRVAAALRGTSLLADSASERRACSPVIS